MQPHRRNIYILPFGIEENIKYKRSKHREEKDIGNQRKGGQGNRGLASKEKDWKLKLKYFILSQILSLSQYYNLFSGTQLAVMLK